MGLIQAAAVVALGGLVASGCATSPLRADAGGPLRVVAAENFWGSLAGQLGGGRVRVTSLVDNPSADPHSYEPTVANARALARARVVIVNGIGYDGWASKVVAANPLHGRVVVDVGDVVRVHAGGNPHRWYSPDDVRRMLDAITAAYERADPADAAYFAQRQQTVLSVNFATYFAIVATIRSRYAGTPIGASESVVAPLADALGLRLITPRSFLNAISEGNDPNAADKTVIDRQIAERQIAVYVYNRQNATPDVQSQIDAARRQGIPIATVTETLTPAGASFEDWQVGQLRELLTALAQGTGR